MDIFKFIKENTYGIEKLDIPTDKKIDKILLSFSTICAATAVQPIPFADIFILTPIQLYMGTLIARVRGYEFTMSQVYKEILGLLGLSYLAQQTAIGLYKTVLPFLGGFMTIPLVFGLTYAIGKVMNFYFVSKTEGKKFTKEDLINVFKQERKEAKKNFSKEDIKKRVKETREEMKNYNPSIKEFIQKNIDELAVISVISKLKDGKILITDEENIILEAIIRSSNKITDLDSAAEFAKVMASRGSEALMGAANNIKGIAHELIYVKRENSDGDTTFAFMPEDTTYPKFDVIEVNASTGEHEWLQLKTTMNPAHINNWIEKYPGSEGSLRINQEMADQLGFKSSGISDKEVSINTNDFIDKLIEMDDSILTKIFTYTPPLAVISASYAVYNLYTRYKKKEITKQKFFFMSAKVTGLKASKVLLLVSLLALPVVGQVVAVYLISYVMLSVIGKSEVNKENLLLPAPSKI
jgi:uncharacterized protein (DUF697 family)